MPNRTLSQVIDIREKHFDFAMIGVRHGTAAGRQAGTMSFITQGLRPEQKTDSLHVKTSEGALKLFTLFVPAQ